MKIEYYIIERQCKDGSKSFSAIPFVYDQKERTGAVASRTPYTSKPYSRWDFCCGKMKSKMMDGMEWLFGNFENYYEDKLKVNTSVNMVGPVFDETGYGRVIDANTYDPISFCPYCGEKIDTVEIGTKLVLQKSRKVIKERMTWVTKEVEEDEDYWEEEPQ